MKKLFYLLLLIFSCFNFAQKTFAIEDPLTVTNNKIGIHILFPQELDAAARLVNSNGGDWGYITIPIQINDLKIEKWQPFMDLAKEKHLIPIIRLATESYYFNSIVWVKPAYSDVLDFANFLNSLDWPTKNRYVVIFNEPNRADEWQADPSPSEYANILSYAAEIFKSLSPDFFIISAGLDNAAPTVHGQSINEYTFLQEMNNEIPAVFDQIDGFASHSYPNPGFSQPPFVATPKNISSFSFEKNFIQRFTQKDIPVFITETGWSKSAISDATAAFYYSHAFSSVWSDKSVVAVTPFLLRAGAGPFIDFSFVGNDQKPTLEYRALETLIKIKGSPVLVRSKTEENVKRDFLPAKKFAALNPTNTIVLKESLRLKTLLKWFLRI